MNPAPRAYALVLAVGLAASLPSLRNGFVYDDVAAVQSDERIRSLADPLHLLALPYWGGDVKDLIYRPLTTASFAVDWALGQGSAFPFHLTNLLLHLLVCALVYALARRALGRGLGALVAGLWFAVHPLHVEAFAGVVGRSELIAAAGYLAAVLAWLADANEEGRAPAGRRRLVLALVVMAAAAVAYGGKEHALTLPAALLLADAWVAWVRNGRFREVFRRHALLWIAVVVIAAGFLAARAAVVGTAFGGGSIGAGLDGFSAPQRLVVMLPALLVWLRLFAWPVALSADYSPNAFVPGTSLDLAHLLAAVIILGAVAIGWRVRRTVPVVFAGLAWITVTASVAMNIVVPTGVLLAERVLYLPSVGAALIVGALWERLYVRAWNRFQRPAWVLTALVIALLAARTLARIPVWHDGERFYEALVHDAPESYRSHWARGARAFERQAAREGEQHYQRAIRTWPFDPALYQELGERYLAAGMWAPADRYLTASYRIDTLRTDAAVQAMLARLRLGLFDSAEALGREAVRRSPRAATLYLALGDAYQGLGRPVAALSWKRRLVFARPDQWQSHHIAAEGAARAGLCDEAIMRSNQAVRLAPRDEGVPRAMREHLDRDMPRCGLNP